MSDGSNSFEVARFVGLDVHRTYASVAGVDANQEQVLNVRRIDYKDFHDWIRKNLRPTDAVALESTGNAWYFHDLLAPLWHRSPLPTQFKLR